ncbi:MAG TPA: hypothetical protein VK403_07125 [Allosphingosinicella sp.]|nr:hypothetical protein [Allosphingosinicella sp.]
MEQTYWLGRKRSSAANARRAASAEARLVHLDLAGRYSTKAAAAAVRAPWAAPEAAPPAPALPPLADTRYYEQLETGARWLASRVTDGAEREGHLGNADRYARLRLDAAAAGRR